MTNGAIQRYQVTNVSAHYLMGQQKTTGRGKMARGLVNFFISRRLTAITGDSLFRWMRIGAGTFREVSWSGSFLFGRRMWTSNLAATLPPYSVPQSQLWIE